MENKYVLRTKFGQELVKHNCDPKLIAALNTLYEADLKKTIKCFCETYSDLLSAQGYDLNSINQEVVRLKTNLEEEIL